MDAPSVPEKIPALSVNPDILNLNHYDHVLNVQNTVKSVDTIRIAQCVLLGDMVISVRMNAEYHTVAAALHPQVCAPRVIPGLNLRTARVFVLNHARETVMIMECV